MYKNIIKIKLGTACLHLNILLSLINLKLPSKLVYNIVLFIDCILVPTNYVHSLVAIINYYKYVRKLVKLI